MTTPPSPRRPAQRRASTPDRRAADVKQENQRVRRRYKLNIAAPVKLLPAEVKHVENMVVILKVAGYSRVQMAKAIGISRGQVRAILEKPEISEEIEVLRSILPRAALELIQGYMIEAVMAIVDVLRSSPDDKIILQAAGDILDRGGMPKASRQERHSVNEERTTFTDEGIVERLREAKPEIQEEAAQLIEKLEELLAVHADQVEDTDEESAE
jgi:DNA-binding XRE family transcriptional regulator